MEETKTQSLMEPAMLNDRTNKIFSYVEAYNSMAVEKMTVDFDDQIVFLNLMNGEKTMELQGIEDFTTQAIETLSYFSERQQAIETLTHNIDSSEISINYRAVAAMDFPNGLKKGDEITLAGKSIFEFSADGKIVKLTDIA